VEDSSHEAIVDAVSNNSMHTAAASVRETNHDGVAGWCNNWRQQPLVIKCVSARALFAVHRTSLNVFTSPKSLLRLVSTTKWVFGYVRVHWSPRTLSENARFYSI